MKKKKIKKEIIEEKETTFRDYFKFPLKRSYSKVFTDDFGMAFDFVFPMLVPDAFTISDENKDKLVKILNGEEASIEPKVNIEHKNGIIYADNREFLWIRSWGRLTGTGGYKLSTEKAAQIQDEFGQFIVNTLNK